MLKRKIFTIKDINQYIKNLLDGDSLLSNVWLKGEITNFKLHSSGHMYFSLKDQGGIIKCVMFKGHNYKLKFKPAHGMEVLALGYVSVYERDGQYQFYVEDMLPEGAGSLNLAFLQLKEKLSLEGLFRPEKKRALPYLPKKVAIVTSPTGAALKDILTIIKRRSPQTEIVVVPVLVQGREAASSICKGLDKVFQRDVDVIIVGRGGGSLEELWCFNEEEVVRKISQSPIPIISAVGHETDITLADFAADLRAATPSMAAELVSPVREELAQYITHMENRLSFLINNFLNSERQRVEYLAKSPVMKDPFRITANKNLEIDGLMTRLMAIGKVGLDNERSKVNLLAGILDTLSPLKTLDRGYSVTTKDGQVVRDCQAVEIGERVKVLLSKGSLSCLVEGKEEKDNG